MDFDKKVIVDCCGKNQTGKQFDLELSIPEDNRAIVSGIIKDSNGCPIQDAVIKLIEVTKHDRKPVSHTFSNNFGEFVFGPLCPFKSYSIEVWVTHVKHIKICEICSNEGNCLQGIDTDCSCNDFNEIKK